MDERTMFRARAAAVHRSDEPQDGNGRKCTRQARTFAETKFSHLAELRGSSKSRVVAAREYASERIERKCNLVNQLGIAKLVRNFSHIGTTTAECHRAEA